MSRKPTGGANGSGKFDVGLSDMGGWLRVCAGSVNLPDDVGKYLSQALTEWFRQRPHLRLRCVAPIDRDGTTVELHGWYDVHVFSPQAPQPAGNQG